MRYNVNTLKRNNNQKQGTEYSKQQKNKHSDKEVQGGQNMQQSKIYQSKIKPEVRVILEFPKPTAESQQAESEFIGLLKSLYLEKFLKNYMQEEESALESLSTKGKEEQNHE
ncbi:MAG: hypothetical protein IJ326_01745 [Lachnospiraceae bacterium]|nr:hypothetical protein [Lachnospiraceae bacterium]